MRESAVCYHAESGGWTALEGGACAAAGENATRVNVCVWRGAGEAEPGFRCATTLAVMHDGMCSPSSPPRE